MEFDKKKKIALGLFSVLILGSAATYAAIQSNEPEPQPTTQRSPQKSVIQKAKGKKTKESLDKRNKKKKAVDSLSSITENEEAVPSIIGPALSPSKKTIDRSPISQTMAGIDRQISKAKPKVAAPALLSYSPPSKANNTFPSATDNRKSDSNGKTQGPKSPEKPTPPVTPTQPVTPTPPVKPDPPVDPTPTVDYSTLVSILQQASQLTRSLYTPNSLVTFDAATQAGYQLLATQHSSQQQVNSHVQHIQEAINQLVKKADKSVLEEKIKTASEIDQSAYTPETVTKLTNALNSAKALEADENATQTSVDQENILLQEAIDQLVKRADTHELDEQIAKAEALNRDIYIPESLAAVDTALTNAKTIKEDENASQETLDQAKTALEQSISMLKEKEEPEKTLVLIRQLIAECESLTEADYTLQSYHVLSNELTNAKNLLEQSTVTVMQATTQLTALKNAKDQLVKQADKSKLQSILSEVQQLTETDYTEGSWQTLKTALNGAESLKNDANATQEQVDQKVTEIKTALSGLVKK